MYQMQLRSCLLLAQHGRNTKPSLVRKLLKFSQRGSLSQLEYSVYPFELCRPRLDLSLSHL